LDCDPLSLRHLGWYQGCTFRLSLPLSHISLAGGRPQNHERVHDLWLLSDQDCDLAWRALTDQDDPFLVELRPVFTADPPTDWGIRSQKLRLDEGDQHLRATEPAVRVTPDLVLLSEHLGCLDGNSQQRLKTWLGLRYDRPAVPQAYVELAKALAEQLSKKRYRASAGPVRDVLAQFWREEDGSVSYQLVAVLPGGPSEASDDIIVGTRSWIAEAALAVDGGLGSARSIEVYGDEEVGLAFIERSFSLDLSRLSWPPNAPGPVGAT
jgi:hypothetical protein